MDVLASRDVQLSKEVGNEPVASLIRAALHAATTDHDRVKANGATCITLSFYYKTDIHRCIVQLFELWVMPCALRLMMCFSVLPSRTKAQ